jgi:hypothetical protein
MIQAQSRESPPIGREGGLLRVADTQPLGFLWFVVPLFCCQILAERDLVAVYWILASAQGLLFVICTGMGFPATGKKIKAVFRFSGIDGHAAGWFNLFAAGTGTHWRNCQYLAGPSARADTFRLAGHQLGTWPDATLRWQTKAPCLL